MRILRVSLTFLILSFIALPSFAQSPFKGGMNYVVVSKGNKFHPSQIEPAAGDEKRTPTSSQKEDTMEQRVWKKYRSLAAAPQPISDSQNHLALSAPKAAQKQTTKTQNKAPQSSGLAGMLQQYKERKARRAGLRSTHKAN